MSNPSKYQPPAHDHLFAILSELNEEFHDFLHYGLGYNEGQYVVCGADVLEIIIRVDKRLLYFDIFHDMKINDEKKAALFAYWIKKLRPVKIIDNRIKNKKTHANINEKLAVHHLLCVLAGKKKIKFFDGKDGIELEDKNEFLKELCYSFRFRNISIDSMLVLADSINTNSFKQVKSANTKKN